MREHAMSQRDQIAADRRERTIRRGGLLSEKELFLQGVEQARMESRLADEFHERCVDSFY